MRSSRWPIQSAVTAATKSKTESQIKQGIGRIWNELEKAAKAKEKVEAEVEAEDAGDE